MKKLQEDPLAISLRNSSYADVVMLLTLNTTSPGHSATGDAHNYVTNTAHGFGCAMLTTALTQFKLTHGIGHMIGARHQRCSACTTICNPTAFGWARAFLTPPVPGLQLFRTIMADCDVFQTTRIGRWSAPNMPSVLGGISLPTGSLIENNAKRLRNRACDVSDFRSDPPNPPPPSIGITVKKDFPMVANCETCILKCSTAIFRAEFVSSLPPNPNNVPIHYKFEFSSNGFSWDASSINTNNSHTFFTPDHPNIGNAFDVRVSAYWGTDLTTPFSVSSPQPYYKVDCYTGGSGGQRSDLGKNQQNLEDDVAVYPNPIEDVLFIEGIKPNSKIILTDLSGKIMIEKFCIEVVDNKTNLSTEKISSGIYLLTISDTSSRVIKKLIKI
jgi:hypothetical protein